MAVHHEIRVVSSSSSGLSEASSQPEGLMQSLSFCKEYTPPTVECPQLDDFLSMLTRSAAVLSSINVDDASLAGDAGEAVMGYALYQVLCMCLRLCLLVRARVCVCLSQRKCVNVLPCECVCMHLCI